MTVVIPARDRVSQIGQALDSVASQTVRPREIIVVDDGSSDGTGELAAERGARVIRNDESQGAGPARNKAVEAATSTFIAFLDSDDAWAPEHLERSLAAIPGHVFVSSPMIDSLGRGRGNVSGRVRTIDHSALLFPENIVCTSAVVARRDAILDVGGMRPFARAQDLDLWLRLLTRGTAISLAEPTVTYFVPSAYVDPGRESRSKKGTLDVLASYDDEPWLTPKIRKLISAQQAWDQLRHGVKNRTPSSAARVVDLVKAMPYTPEALYGTFTHRARARRFATASTARLAGGDEPSGPRRVAYLVSQYPAFSHAFIANEIASLRARDWEIHTVSVTEPSLPDAPEDRPTAVLQRQVLRALPKVARWLIANPRTVPRGLVGVARIVAERSDKTAGSFLKQFAYLAEAALLVQLLDERRLVHVHVHFANSAADIARLASVITAGRITWSMTVHGPADFENARSADLRGKARDARALFCISEFARGEMATTVARRDADRAVVCRMGVSDATIDIARGVERIAADDDRLRVLFVGRLVAKKDPRGLLRAVLALAALPENSARRIDLTFVGDGPERAVLEAEARRVPRNVTVTVAGAAAHDVVLEHYAKNDVFALPSFSEGLPVVVMEALAAELAVIATPVAAIPELVVDGSTGLLVEPGDTPALVDALSRLWADPELRRALGSAGRRAVEAEFASTTATLVLDDVFEAALSASRHRV